MTKDDTLLSMGAELHRATTRGRGLLGDYAIATMIDVFDPLSYTWECIEHTRDARRNAMPIAIGAPHAYDRAPDDVDSAIASIVF